MSITAVARGTSVVVAVAAVAGLLLSACGDSVPTMYRGPGMGSHMDRLQSRHGPEHVLVTPGRGLADRQIVHVRGTGFVPGRMYQVIECAAVPRRQMTAGECNLSGMVSVAADSVGTVTARLVVQRGPFGRHGVVCNAHRACLVAVTGPSLMPGASAVAPIGFA